MSVDIFKNNNQYLMVCSNRTLRNHHNIMTGLDIASNPYKEYHKNVHYL